MTKTYFMARGRMLRIAHAAGSVVHVHTGAVWLTQEGDGRDYYLGAGSRFQVIGNGLVLAQATRHSSVTVAGNEPARVAKGRSLSARLARFWSWLYAPQARPTMVSL